MKNITDGELLSLAKRLCTKGMKGVIKTDYQFAVIHQGQMVLNNNFTVEEHSKINDKFLYILATETKRYPTQAIKEVLSFRSKTQIARERGVCRRTVRRWEMRFIEDFKREIL
jgi:hypothetical protein